MKKNLLACAAFLSAFACAATGCSSNIDQNADVTNIATDAPAAQTEEAAQQPVVTAEPTTEAPTEPPLLERAEKLLAENPDTIGYISVPNTDVDNPVVQTTDNDYYLHIGFDGQDYRAGTVFMDFRDVFSWKEEEHSENIVLYGHNMADNTMFGSLRRYRQDLEFYKESPFVKFSSNYKDYTYVIFGLVITAGDAAPPSDDLYADPMTWDGFPYWNMEELNDEKHFNYYVDTVESMNMIENHVDVEFGDDLLTLSTCYSDEDNSRFLIVARRLREGETEDSLKKIINGEAAEATEAAAQ
ncbi:MAG: class B sortase [Ruminococcus sp.]|nr:class B sortase [Ruminococcus sp.]